MISESEYKAKFRGYFNMVTYILKEEGMYAPSMSANTLMAINTRISINLKNGLTVRQCVNNIYHVTFNKTA
jgi:hypothetical protein